MTTATDFQRVKNVTDLVRDFKLEEYETTNPASLRDDFGARITVPIKGKDGGGIELSTSYFYKTQASTGGLISRFTDYAKRRGFEVISIGETSYLTRSWPKTSWAVCRIAVQRKSEK